MKRIYFLLALVLGMFVSIGLVRAFLVTYTGEPLQEDALETAQYVSISINITSYNNKPHTFNTSEHEFLTDNGSTYAENPTVNVASVTDKNIWELVKGETEAGVGTWYKLKNVATGRYLSYASDPKYNPNAVETLPEEGNSPNKNPDGTWDLTGWNQWWNEDGWPNCQILLELVDDIADARPFIFKKPSDGVEFLGVKYDDLRENVKDLVDEVDDTRVMMLARIDTDGEPVWVSLNSAYAPSSLSRYEDWAAYWLVTKITVEDDPQRELDVLREGLPTSYICDTIPGYIMMKFAEEVERYNTCMAHIRDMYNDQSSYQKQDWIDAIDTLKTVKALAANWERVPVTAGRYRFICSLSAYYEQQGKYKAMRADGENAMWGDLDSTNLRQIWEVEEINGKLYVKNFGTGGYLYGSSSGYSAQVTLNKKPATAVKFTALSGYDFAIRLTGMPSDLHTNGHGAGSGRGSNIVGWGNNETNTGNSWYIMPLGPDENIEQIVLENKYKPLLKEANDKLLASKMPRLKTDGTSQGLVTNVDQLSSPATETGEGSLEGVIDQDFSTYWHSSWSDTTIDTLNHYLQINLKQPYQNDLMLYYVQRTGVVNDHASAFEVRYGNTADGEFEVADTIVGVLKADRLQQLFTLNLPQPAQFLRIRATAMQPDDPQGYRVYWHASEMNVYPVSETKPSLYERTGQAAQDFEQVLLALQEDTIITQEKYNTLQSAYETFKGAYLDPDSMTILINRAENIINNAVTGTELGQKKPEALEALRTAVTTAKTWFTANFDDCTKATFDEKVNELKDAIEAWNNAEVTGPDTSKWYYIAVPTTYFEENNFDQTESDDDSSDYAKYYSDDHQSLRGARLSIWHAAKNKHENSVAGAEMHVVPEKYWTASTIDLREGNEEYEYNEKLSQWRFIDMGNNYYAIQNRATGLFIGQAEASSVGTTPTSLVPGKFSPISKGHDIVQFQTPYINENEEVAYTYLHLKNSYARACFWQDNSLLSGSSWTLTVAEDIASDYKQTVNVSVGEISLTGIVVPFKASLDNTEILMYDQVLNIDLTNGAIAMKKTESITPGKPVVLFSQTAQTVKLTMSEKNPTFTLTVNNSGLLKGTMDAAGKDAVADEAVCGTVSENDNGFYFQNWAGFNLLTGDRRMVAGNVWLSYLSLSENNPIFDFDAEKSFADYGDDLDQNLFLLNRSNITAPDAVESIKAKLNVGTGIYNLNGQRVSAPVKGLYIINGKKVVIK